MHSLDLTVPLPAATDWSALATADLERIAVALLGPAPGGWVRRGDNFVRIAGKYGSDARKIEAELSALTKEAKVILANCGSDAALRAAAFYHLRFENIHPLCEANGRVGRVILAGQLQQAYKIPLKETLTALQEVQIDYHGLFATNDDPLKFELLVDLLSRITGIVRSPEALKLPASLEPLYPQKGTPKKTGNIRPEDYLKNPAGFKQPRPPQPNNYFRRFH